VIAGSRLLVLALGACDVDRVASFYRDALGFPEVQRHHTEDGELRSVWLDMGSSLLMVERTAEARRRVEGIGSGPFLIAIRIPASLRREWENRLEAHGASIESRTRYTSYARDPEDNRIAISHYGDDQ